MKVSISWKVLAFLTLPRKKFVNGFSTMLNAITVSLVHCSSRTEDSEKEQNRRLFIPK